MDKKWVYQEILSSIFCLTLPKTFIVEPFNVSLVSAIEKFFAFEGFVTLFRRNFSVSQNWNIS